jgi:hypothetical protein
MRDTSQKSHGARRIGFVHEDSGEYQTEESDTDSDTDPDTDGTGRNATTTPRLEARLNSASQPDRSINLLYLRVSTEW